MRTRSRKVVATSALAVGSLMSLYVAAVRELPAYATSMVRPAATPGCSVGSTEVSTDDSIQAAIASAQDDSVICVTADITLSQTLVLDDTSVTLEGSDGTITLRGAGSRILYADFRAGSGADDTVVLRRLTLAGGSTTGLVGDADGGAVLVKGTDQGDRLLMSNMTLVGNYSAEDGGALTAKGLSYVGISNSTFSDDSAANAGPSDVSGGAVKVATTAATSITSCTFTDNYSVEWGGALFLNDSGVTNLSGNLFERNRSRDNAGGAIEIDIDDSTLPGAIYLSNSTFSDNEADGNVGGAVRITDNDDTVVLTNLTFDSNVAGSNGGAVNVSNQSGPLSLASVRFYDNSSTASGGSLRISGLSAPLSLTDVTSARNSATGDGGSVRINSTSTVTLRDSTFYDDSAGVDGGALYLRTTEAALISGSIFRGNTANDDAGGVYLRSDNASVATANFVIENTLFSGNVGTGADSEGGAAQVFAANAVTIRDSYFVENRTDLDGAGVYAGDLGVLRVERTDFMRNIAQDDAGGLMVRNSGSIYVSESVVQGNRALGDDGGGILINNVDDTISLSEMSIDQNLANNEGGGVKIVSSDGRVFITEVAVTDNSAGSSGGGMYVNDPVLFDIRDSRFEGNHSDFEGGGLLIDNSSAVNPRLLLRDLTLDDNSAVDMGGSLLIETDGSVDVYGTTVTNSTSGKNGAGAHVYLAGLGTLEVVNSTFAGNRVTSPAYSGGGIAVVDGDVTMSFVTIAGNSAGNAGGVGLDDTVVATVSNSIIAGNSASGTGPDVLVGTYASLDDSFALFTSPTSVVGDSGAGPGTLFGDPRLAPLADNGGPTRTILPREGSPAVAAGDPAWSAPPTYDQRGPGYPRNAGGRVSMGAVQGFALPPPPPARASAPREVLAAPGDGELTATWKAPASSGAFPITHYQVLASPAGESCLTVTLSCTVSDLPNDVEQTVLVRALTGAGWGAWSEPVEVTPFRPTVRIAGSRKGTVVRLRGVSTVEDDSRVRVWMWTRAWGEFRRVKPVALVDDEGAFRWRKRLKREVPVRVYVTIDGVRSNRIRIA